MPSHPGKDSGESNKPPPYTPTRPAPRAPRVPEPLLDHPTSSSNSSISSSAASNVPLIRPSSSSRKRSKSRSPSPTTVPKITTTNSEEKQTPSHRRLMQFMLYQQKKQGEGGDGSGRSPSPLASEIRPDRSRSQSRDRRGDGRAEHLRSQRIAPPPLPKEYTGSDGHIRPTRVNPWFKSTAAPQLVTQTSGKDGGNQFFPSTTPAPAPSNPFHRPQYRPLKSYPHKQRHRWWRRLGGAGPRNGQPPERTELIEHSKGARERASKLKREEQAGGGFRGAKAVIIGTAATIGTTAAVGLPRDPQLAEPVQHQYSNELRHRKAGVEFQSSVDSDLPESERLLKQQEPVRTPPIQYTTDRKSNRQARMSQGPTEYHSWKEILLDFCARTSSHGIPFVGTHSFFGRIIWLIITLVAFLAFCIQTYYTLSDYLSYRTIIEMQLKFEPAPFPAATLCNLNSFKFSELRKFEEIEMGFKLWERAISTLDQQLLIVKEEEKALLTARLRKRRQIKYQPVYVKCVCNLPDDQCVPQRNDLDVNASVCLCFEDARTGDIWPCYAKSAWIEKKCFHCSLSNTCDDPDKPPNITTLLTEPRERDCLCQSISHYCLVRNPMEEIKWWNPHNYSVYPITEPPPLSSEVEEAFGLEDLRDRGAITTKTKENLIFLVAAMPRETRQQLSYTLDEFVLRCSFNSKDCDLKRDFQMQIDPEYGNCFTFNFNDSVELKNSRAGPMYGLRLLLNVNQSDYMPTTEAAGVRLVVHEQDQEPFPDTFGYSAPTGFISSFGLKAKVLDRLDSPYGKCSDTFRPENYIYAEHYSPEGCYRNCFQQIIVERCGCGDPRFPLPHLKDMEIKPCDARNHAERSCLANETSVLGGFHHLTHDCHCVQPCKENVFETAYSAAAWPANNFNIGADCAAVLETENFTQDACLEYYRQNTAYIEIYYEQLNFESLKETPGYTMVNLFSDLGGNIGLWIGFSLITVLEFVELLCECITFGCEKCVFYRIKRRQRRARTMNALVGAAYMKPADPAFLEEEEQEEERKRRRSRPNSRSNSPPPLLVVQERDEKGGTVYYYGKSVGGDTTHHLSVPSKPRRSSFKRESREGGEQKHHVSYGAGKVYYIEENGQLVVEESRDHADAQPTNGSLNRSRKRLVRIGSPPAPRRRNEDAQEFGLNK